MEKLIPLMDAAVLCGYCDQHLRKLCREKKIAHTRRGNRFFFTTDELEKLNVHVAPKTRRN